MDMIDDIIHELAHAVERNNEELVYGTGSIQENLKQTRKTCLLINHTEMYDVPKIF
jgi:hypothetical protein